MTPTPVPHTHRSPPAQWVQRWSHLLAAGCSVLDVACGAGRHLQWFAQRAHNCWGVDRDIQSAVDLTDSAHPGTVQLLQADTENAPWPLMDANQPRQFGAVVVTNYLWRPLLPTLVESLAPGGVLIYETFAAGNETVGRPARAEFLLQPGELLQSCADLHVVAFEQGFAVQPERFVQRIAAVRPLSTGLTPQQVRSHLL